MCQNLTFKDIYLQNLVSGPNQVGLEKPCTQVDLTAIEILKTPLRITVFKSICNKINQE